MQITHGTVTLRTNSKASGTVVLLDFPAFVQNQQNPRPPAGTIGVLTLKSPPSIVNYAVGNVIDF